MNASSLKFKILLLGDGSVGKSSIILRFINKTFEPIQETIGVNFLSFNMTISNNPITLQIWDTAGQENYRSIGKAYYRDASCVFIVFALDSHKSFEDVAEWMKDVEQRCLPDTLLFLIGNKSDLEDKREVSADEANEYALTHRMTYCETSALANSNVEETFVQAAQDIFQKSVNDIVLPEVPQHLDEEPQPQKKCKC